MPAITHKIQYLFLYILYNCKIHLKPQRAIESGKQTKRTVKRGAHYLAALQIRGGVGVGLGVRKTLGMARPGSAREETPNSEHQAPEARDADCGSELCGFKCGQHDELLHTVSRLVNEI